MEEFLGVLFCGGRGERLGEITRYISKPFVPVYDRPVFRYGLELLDRSRHIRDIVILTNEDNDEKLRRAGYPTIVQDDDAVSDMLTGWDFIKKTSGRTSHGVLMPGDNVSDVDVDALVELFLETGADIVFSLYDAADPGKLAQMGTYDGQTGRFFYKNPHPGSRLGVIAPYIVRNSVDTSSGDEAFNSHRIRSVRHSGYWFDVGDPESLLESGNFIRKRRKD